MRRNYFWLNPVRALAIGMTYGLTCFTVQAEITLDGTLGPSGSLPGPDFVIPAEVGQQLGGNLFHSFGLFNINATESATFTGPDSVQNILGRITGGSSSTIDGLLRSEIPGANLFLLNPAGMLFGPNAQLDIPGSFHASTADFLRLGEEGRFDAARPQASLLTVAPPSAFGFLGDSPAGISLQGSNLRVPRGETLSLIGGNLAIQGSQLAVPGGRINIATAASSGEVIPDAESLEVGSFERLGEINISQGSVIDIGGGGGEGIFIRGETFVLADGSAINSSTASQESGGDINIITSGSATIAGIPGGVSTISSTTFGEGDAGVTV